MLGRDLENLIQRARKFKKQFDDSFVSVEHLLLGFLEDNRFGKQLYKEFKVSEKTLRDAIQSIRGRQRVVDQGINFLFLCLYIYVLLYILWLVLVLSGKLLFMCGGFVSLCMMYFCLLICWYFFFNKNIITSKILSSLSPQFLKANMKYWKNTGKI